MKSRTFRTCRSFHRLEFNFPDVANFQMRLSDFSRRSLALGSKEAKALPLHRLMRMSHQRDHKVRRLLEIIREATAVVANARRVSRIGTRGEVMLDHREMIGRETIVLEVIGRRGNGTPQIVRRLTRSLQIGHQVNNQSQTLPLVDRLVNDLVAPRSLNERGQWLMTILELAWRELFLRRYQSLSRF